MSVVRAVSAAVARGVRSGVHGAGGGAASTTLTNNLVSWWTLDEASGTRVDSVGANNLTDNNTVTSTTGKVGNCSVHVVANSEYLSKASPTGLHGGDRDFSVAGWCYLDDLTANRSFFAVGLDGGGLASQGDWGLIYNQATARFEFFGNQSPSTFKNAQASTFGAPSATTFYFVYGYYDSVNDELGISVNDGTIDTTASVTALNNTGNEFMIGGRYANVAYLDGRVDEVGFWSRLLTTDEVTELYNSGSGIGYPG